MNKKINYLAIIPFVGAGILLLWLFIRGLQNDIDIYKVLAYSFISGMVCVISVVGLLIIVRIISFYTNIANILYYVDFAVLAIGGFLMNLCAFRLVNKNWDELHKID